MRTLRRRAGEEMECLQATSKTYSHVNSILFCPQCETIFHPTIFMRDCPCCANRSTVSFFRRNIVRKEAHDESAIDRNRRLLYRFSVGHVDGEDCACAVCESRRNKILIDNNTEAQPENLIVGEYGVFSDWTIKSVFGGFDVFRKLFQPTGGFFKVLSWPDADSLADIRSRCKRAFRRQDVRG